MLAGNDVLVDSLHGDVKAGFIGGGAEGEGAVFAGDGGEHGTAGDGDLGDTLPILQAAIYGDVDREGNVNDLTGDLGRNVGYRDGFMGGGEGGSGGGGRRGALAGGEGQEQEQGDGRQDADFHISSRRAVQVNLPIIVHIFGGDERGDPAPKLSLTVPIETNSGVI